MTHQGGTVLVTGATGFVGRHVHPALRDAGWNVIGACRPPGRGGNVALPLDDEGAVRELLAVIRPDVVVHLAGVAHRRASRNEYDRVNHRGTDYLARALAEGHAGATFVYASSASIYGDGPFDRPVDEAHPPSGDSPYALSKLRGERAALSYAPAIRAIALRFPALYDADWLFNVRKRACAPAPFDAVLLKLSGSQPRYSFCAAENAARAIVLAASGVMRGGVYNVADREPATQADVTRAIAAREGGHVTLPLPFAGVRALYAASALLPPRLRARTRQAYHKFVDGLVLDCSRAACEGYEPVAAFTDLFGAPSYS